jgi:hypothetical protein
MNTEKLEKLKKSLDNQFIPDNMKDKIRAEIKKLEADIKTDDTMTTTEIKSEVKEIEKEVEKALEVAEKKEEQAEAKAPAKTRAKRTTTSRTKKPKVEEKPTAKKKTFTAIAKEIRKAGESWEDAKLRARKMMKSETTEIKKKTRTETDKLLAMVRRNKEYKKLAGTSNLSKDAQRRAMPRGKRVSTKGWKNQYGESEGGKVYYENRANRVDVGGFKSAYLETGGGVGKMKKPTLKKGDVVFVVGRRWFDRVNGNTYHTAEVFVNDKYVGKSRMTYGYDESYIQTAKEILLDSYELPKGMRDTSPLWQLREYGVTLNKTVSDGLKRDLETGGTIIGTAETPLARGLGISYTGLVGETGAMSSGEMFAGGGGLKQEGYYVFSNKRNVIISDGFKTENEAKTFMYDYFEKNPDFSLSIKKYEQGGSLVDGYLTDPNFGDFQAGVYADGGSTGLPEGTQQHFVNYYLGEGTAQGIYAEGGGVKKRSLKSVIHLVDWKGEGIKKWYLRSYPTDEMGEELNDTVTFKDLWDSLNAKKNVYEIMGVGDSLIRERLFEYLSLIYNVDYDVVYNKWLESADYAKGGGVRMVGNREYPTGRAWTNEHRQIDKADIREVNYTRKKSFDDGGELEDKMQYGSWYVNIKEDENDEEIRNIEVARLIREGYFSGFEPSWYLEITDIEGDIDEATEEEIARLVEQGYTSGEVVIYKDSYAKGGGVSPFKNMMETNTITEKEINLIKLRMNNDKVDDFTQEAIDFIWDNSPQLTSDQNKKGIDYLRNLWKSPTGKERTNNPFGYREQDALETFEYFELRGFYDAGNRYRKFYVPLYTCVGAETSFEYYISGGEINIVG